jgi:hypothetical protein
MAGLARGPGAPWRLAAAAGLLAAALAAAGVAAAGLLPGAAPPCQQLAIPAYFYPGGGWAKAIGSKPVPAIMIAAITSSGPGDAPDPAYQAVIGRAQAAGIKVLGYASTDYARRPAADVETDIAHYRAWYHVAGVFLDQAAAGTGELPYYQELTGYIRATQPGAFVMLNPGTYPARQYMSLGAAVVTFEGSYASYAGLHVPGWASAYPAGRFAHIVYATSGQHLGRALGLAEARNAGYVYVTDGAGANPYHSLPAYWASENALVAAGCAATEPGRTG